MEIYMFDGETKEYIGAEDALLDPLETKKLGKPVYLLPENAALIGRRLPKTEKPLYLTTVGNRLSTTGENRRSMPSAGYLKLTISEREKATRL